MKSNYIKIIIFGIFFFFICVFFIFFLKDSNYNTKNLIGKKISTFNLPSIYDEKKIIEDKILKKNKYTLINFFASWCSPCRSEHKYLMKLSKKNNEIKIIGINYKDKKNNALKFLIEMGDPYDLIGVDFNGSKSISFGIYGIPESILIDNELKIIKKFIGPINESHYYQILKLIS